MQTITITPNWQIHLPVEFRKKLGLREPGKMKMKLVDNNILLMPKKSAILQMAGKYKGRKQKKKINIEKIRDEIDYSCL